MLPARVIVDSTLLSSSISGSKWVYSLKNVNNVHGEEAAAQMVDVDQRRRIPFVSFPERSLSTV